VVIGIGNPWRGDDAVGWHVAQGTGRRLAGRIGVVLTDGEPARLLDAWADTDCAVLVDAMRTGAEPGTIGVWGAGAAPAPPPARNESHRFSVAAAIALGAALDALPRRLTIVGVEVGDLGAGQPMTARVAAAVEPAVQLVVDLVLEHGRGLTGASSSHR
jgi:hydrogenase maturation protease